MSDKDNCDLETNEVNIFADFLSGVAKTSHQKTFNNFIELNEESIPMVEPSKFVDVVVILFKCNETRKSGNTIKQES
jgi:hypothetical protein